MYKMYKLFYKIKEIKNQESQIEKLGKEKKGKNVQITNYERERIHTDIKRKRKKESTELLENYSKTLDDLKVSNKKIKTFEERKVKSYY